MGFNEFIVSFSGNSLFFCAYDLPADGFYGRHGFHRSLTELINIYLNPKSPMPVSAALTIIMLVLAAIVVVDSLVKWYGILSLPQQLWIDSDDDAKSISEATIIGRLD